MDLILWMTIFILREEKLMSYLKKNGTIKKYYIQACECILKGSKRKVEIVDCYDHIKDTYYCYSVSFQSELCNTSREKDLLRKHISDISEEYGLIVNVWYTLQGWENIDYKDQDILFEKMQKDIKNHLGDK